jgi:hypothetical protein
MNLDQYKSKIEEYLKADAPVLLFPLRLETRFYIIGSQRELWIRVFPDQAAINSHNHMLSPEEINQGQRYWQASDKTGIWRELAGRYGVERAVWIVRETSNEPVWGPKNHTGGGQSIVMPEQLVFILHRNGHQPRYEPGLPINLYPLPIGLTDDGETGLDWVTQFDVAIERGLGIKILISEEEYEEGFSRVLAIGVTFSSPEDGKDKLQTLLRDHQYEPGGLALIPPGTPTNNMSDDNSGFSSSSDVDHAFEQIVQTPLATHENIADKSDSEVLAQTFGIDHTILRDILDKNMSSRRHARAMNTALWPATMGEYLEEFLNSYYHILTRAGINLEWNIVSTLDKVRGFMCDHVKGRGATPTLRISKQPYGILPVSSFSEWKTDDSDQFADQLWALLLQFRGKWKEMAEQQVYNLPQAGDPLWQFMDLLGLSPHSVEYFSRYGMDKSQLAYGGGGGFPPQLTSFSADLFAWLNLADLSGGHANDHVDINLAQLRFLQQHASLSQKPVYPSDKKNTHLPRKKREGLGSEHSRNYIQHIRQTSIYDLYGSIQTPSSESENTLLFHLLRHAKLNQYWDAAVRVYEEIDLEDLRFGHLREEDWRRIMLQADIDIDSLNEIGSVHSQAFDLFREKDFRIGYKDIIGMKASDLIDADGKILHPAFYFLSNPPGFLYANGVLKEDYTISEQDVLDHWHRKIFDRSRYREFVIQAALDYDLYDEYVSYITDKRPEERLSAIKDLLTAGSRYPFLFFRFGRGELPGLENYSINAPGMPIAKYLATPMYRQHFSQQTQQLVEHNEALDILSELTVGELERLLAEHIDLCTYRLDAWLLGIVNQRLNALRTSNPTGIYLGAYGYVENLKPTSDSARNGYIHTPSLQHAVTASVLRAGYQANGNNSVLAVNLDSERVRRASYYLDGIRQGRELDELLGYRFERNLRDAGLSRLILDFRQEYPAATASENTTSKLSWLVNGLKLIQEPPDEATFGNMKITDTQVISTIGDIVHALEGDLDAVGDLLLSEGVYQLLGGNYERAAAVAEVLTVGRRPPDMEFIRTPRTGFSLTHRVCLAYSVREEDEIPLGWPDHMTRRAKLEPSLNYWLGELLGDPATIECRCKYNLQQSPGIYYQVKVSLLDLNLQPIDLLYLFSEGYKSTDSLLSVLIWRKAEEKMRLGSPDQIINRKTDWSPKVEKTFAEADIWFTHLRELIGSGQALQAADWRHPQDSVEDDTSEQTDLVPRMEAGINRLKQDITELEKLIARLESDIFRHKVGTITTGKIRPGKTTFPKKTGRVVKRFPSANFNQLASFLKIGIEYDWMGTWKREVSTPTVEDAKSLVGQARSLGRTLKNRLDEVLTITKSGKEKAYNSKILEVIFPRGASLIPSFKIPVAAKSILSKDLTPSSQELVMEKWLDGIARVRDNMEKVERSMLINYTWKKGSEKQLRLTPTQLPYRPQDHWVGWELPEQYFEDHDKDAKPVSRNKLSLVIVGIDPIVGERAAGLLLDDWNEVIPATSLTTGLAYHYNDPDARPPQTLLLAIHPKGIANSISWTLELLEETILEAFDLARIRAVEPDHFLKPKDDNIFKQILPAILPRVVDPAYEKDWSLDFGNFSEEGPLFTSKNDDHENGTGGHSSGASGKY